MIIVERVRQSEELIQWLDRLIDGLSVPSGQQALIAASCLDVSMEHHKAIVVTTMAKLFGSAAALLRLQFEAYVRGVWLAACASNGDVNRFKKDKLKQRLGEMVADLEKRDDFNVGVLSTTMRERWKAMCSYTHTGCLQVVRRIKESELVPNYDDEEVSEMLLFGDSVSLLTAFAIVNLTTGPQKQKEQLALQLLERVCTVAR